MSIIEILPKDTINHILSLIETNKDKFNFLITCKHIISLTVFFNENVLNIKIRKSRWYNQFTHVCGIPSAPFPLHIQKISFDDNFNSTFFNSYLPNVTHLFLGSVLCEENLFEWNGKYSCEGYFNQYIPTDLPSSITHLVFSRDFNQPIFNRIPSSVKHLIFGDEFNQSVDELPLGITHLRFGYFFNRKIDKLPPTITHLEFGDQFNQPIYHLPLWEIYENV